MTVLNLRTFASTPSRSRIPQVTRYVCQMSILLFAALALLSASRGHAQDAKPTVPQLDRGFGKVPLSFEPNRGQTDARVQFLSRGQGYALYLTAGEAVVELQKPLAKTESGQLQAGSRRQETSTLGMTLVGANREAAASAQDLLPGTVNYFPGNDRSKWQTGLPTYGRVTYRGIYPGVDLVYYGNQRELEYDFVVSPGADARAIGLKFTGSTPKIDKGGDLVLAVAGGETRFHKPVIYQMAGDRRVSIEGGYEIADGKVGFSLGSYDQSKALIIDPVLSYLTYFGGSSNDLTNGLAIDSSGNTYVVGTTNSIDFPTKNPYQAGGPGTGGRIGTQSIFVSKFNPTGTALVYSTYIGSKENTEGFGIAVDTSGNAYVVGDTTFGDYPVTAGAFQTVCGGSNTVPQGATQGVRANGCVGAGQGDEGGVLTKLNPTGNALVYSTFLSGNNYNSARVVAVNAAGEAYVAGLTNSQCNFGVYGLNGTGYQAYDCYPTTGGAAQAGITVSTGGGIRNFTFFSKLDAAGANMIYSTLLGPNNFGQQSTTAPLAIAIDPAGLAYVSGYSSNNLFTTAGSYQPAAGALNSAYGFVAKFNPTPQTGLIYSTYVSGPKGSMPYVAVDAAGNAYLAGNTLDCGYPTTAGAYQTQARFPAGSNANCTAGFVSKLNPTGTALVWSTFIGNDPTNGEQTALDAIALGSDGSIYVAGDGSYGGYPLVNPLQATQTNYYQYPVITRLNATGTGLLFSTVISGTSQSAENVTGIAVDPAGNIYIAGTTNSATLPTTPGVFQSTNTKSGAYYAGFLAKIAPTINTMTTLTLPSGTVTAGQPAILSAKVAGPIGTTNTPTGTVTFLSGSTTLGTGTLDATGTASYTAASLNATTYTVTASYPGDSSFTASVSAVQTLVVSPAVSTVALTAPASAVPGASVTLSVRVTGTGGSPTGSVTFKDGTATLATVALASGAATYTSTAFAVGSHSLTASYTGDSIFGAATSSTQTLAVALLTPTVTLTAPATALVGASVTLSASVTGASGSPSGSVTFKDGSTVLSTVTLASGAASYATAALAVGAHIITASYSGDTTFSAVTSAASTVTINVAPAISFTAAPASLTVVHGQSATTVITGTPVGGYTGTVTFACGALPAGASCAFVPSSLTFTGTNVAASTTLTFSTVTTTASLKSLPGLGALGGVFAAVLLMPLAMRRKSTFRRGRLLVWMLLLGGSASLFGVAGCGGGSAASTPTTTTTVPGVYTVPVTVTAGAAVSTLNISITVQ